MIRLTGFSKSAILAVNIKEWGPITCQPREPVGLGFLVRH